MRTINKFVTFDAQTREIQKSELLRILCAQHYKAVRRIIILTFHADKRCFLASKGANKRSRN